MDRAAYVWLSAAFAVAFFAVGVPYWRIPYSEVNLPGALHAGQLAVVAAAAILAQIAGRAGVVRTALVIAAAVPAAILARVVNEVAADPTSHNLWPFEVVIGVVLGLIPAAAGALLGALLLRTGRR
jgi:hypothetical protein